MCQKIEQSYLDKVDETVDDVNVSFANQISQLQMPRSNQNLSFGVREEPRRVNSNMRGKIHIRRRRRGYIDLPQNYHLCHQISTAFIA